MQCLHCASELEFENRTAEASKFYHCAACDRWYELRKDRERVNGAVPVRFFEVDGLPEL